MILFQSISICFMVAVCLEKQLLSPVNASQFRSKEIELIISTLNHTILNITRSRNISQQEIGETRFINLLQLPSPELINNVTRKLKAEMKTTGKIYIFHDLTLNEMAQSQNSTIQLILNKTLLAVFESYNRALTKGQKIAQNPIVVVAYTMGITITEILHQNLLNLASRLTGMPKTIIKKIYMMTDSEYLQAQQSTLPLLKLMVKTNFNVDFQIKHFYSMSFSSLANAFLVHKNITEGRRDFIRDVEYLLRNITLQQLKSIYSLNDTWIGKNTITSLAMYMTGIDGGQLRTIFKTNQVLHRHWPFARLAQTSGQIFVEKITFSEMATTMSKSLSSFMNLTVSSIHSAFNQSMGSALRIASQPIVFAAYNKGITIAEVSIGKLLDLALRITGMPKTVIKKIYMMKDSDFLQAQQLTLPQLKIVVKSTFGVSFELKQFYSMSFSSLANAFLVHKNVTEAKQDFLRDFKFIAFNMTLGLLRSTYDLDEKELLKHTIPSLCYSLAGLSLSEVSVLFELKGHVAVKLPLVSIADILLYSTYKNKSMDLFSSTLGTLQHTISPGLRINPYVFSNVSEVLSKAKTRVLNSSFSDIIVGAQIDEVELDTLLKTIFVSKDFFGYIRNKTIQKLIGSKVLKVDINTISSLTVWRCFSSIINIKDFFEMPIVVAAYRNKISYNQLQNGNLASIFVKILGFETKKIVSKLKINESNIALITNNNLLELSSRSLSLFVMKLNVKQLHTLSFSDLFDAVISKQSTQATLKALRKSLIYISRTLSIADIKSIFGIMDLDTLSIGKLFSSYFNATTSAALNCSKEQESLLDRVLIHDAKILTGISMETTFMTPQSYGKQLLSLGPLLVTLFTAMNEYLQENGRHKDDIMKISFKEFLSINQISVTQIQFLLDKLRILPQTLNFMNYHKLGDFVTAFQMSRPAFSRLHLFAFMKEIAKKISSGSIACQSFSQSCPVNAGCYDSRKSLYCRCNDGFSWNGKICYDGCKSNTCNDGSTCINLPNTIPVCRCKKSGFFLENNKCSSPDGEIFKVKGMKFNQPYKDSYKNQDSADFKTKASEMESVLQPIICPQINGCVALLVVKISQGSIVIDYNIILTQNAPNITKERVLLIAQNSIEDPRLSVLNPDKSASYLQVEVTNLCEAGAHNCDTNAVCIPGTSGKFSCKCKEDYIKDGEKCTKKSKNVAAIVVPVVLGIILITLVIGAFARHYYRKRRNSSLPFSAFSGSYSSEIELTVQ